jgi:hypothetical protein
MPDSKSKNYMIMTNEGKGTLTFLLWILKYDIAKQEMW